LMTTSPSPVLSPTGLVERVAKPRRVIRGFGVRLVTQPRPEKSAQAVAPGSRHNVKMQMRHALTDDVICRYERALAAQGRWHNSTDQLDAKKERPDGRGRQVRKGYDVLAGSHQDMTLEHRPAIQEGDDLFVGADDVRWHQASGDVTE
jgi:hypothetical protein